MLVTGGAGFVGGALISQLLMSGTNEVVCLDHLGYSADVTRLESHVRLGLRFEQADVTDRDAVREIFERWRPQAVFHLAAESHVDRSIDEPGGFISTNVVGTATMLEQSLAHWQTFEDQGRSFRFVHVSTDEVFGSAGPAQTFDLDTPYDPRSPYAASKAAADHLVRAWHHTYGLPVIVTNCSNNYGPHQFPEKLIPHTIIRALHGETLPLYGDGLQVRDWLHVDDHARALLAALQRGVPGSTYLVGARSRTTNLDLVTRICSALDRLVPSGRPHRERIEFVADRPGHDRRYAIDPTSAEQELGWSPEISFDEGIESTVAWYVDHQDWLETIVTSGYVPTRLGLKS